MYWELLAFLVIVALICIACLGMIVSSTRKIRLSARQRQESPYAAGFRPKLLVRGEPRRALPSNALSKNRRQAEKRYQADGRANPHGAVLKLKLDPMLS